jgi:hypothetical protein
MRTFVTPAPSPRFYTLLAVYHLFPLHMPLTTYLLDAPFGRFSNGKSRFNVNGEFSIERLAALCSGPVGDIDHQATLLGLSWRA